jgi:iron-sulfur cluster repair protein YtfE (RIC family)
MPSISGIMTDDHRHCDQLFADAEASVSQGDWATAAAHYVRFRDAMEHHFTLEEQVLFPAFEGRTGSGLGPTQVMRMEHIQMRRLLEEMDAAARDRQPDAYLGTAETLIIIMQQHNMKEEQILYRMTDQLLGDQADQLIQQMRAL